MAKVQKKLIREGDYVAEMGVTLLDTIDPWGPHLSPEDARKLDEVRVLLRRGDLTSAVKFAQIYRLTPVVPSEPPQ